MDTDRKVGRVWRMSNTEKTQEIAAAKIGVDLKTARKYLEARKLPSEMRAKRRWRTRKDAFADVWPEVEARLAENPGLEAKTVFAALQRQYGKWFSEGKLRTLQRRLKRWRATGGPAQEVYFAQNQAGRLRFGPQRSRVVLISSIRTGFEM